MEKKKELWPGAGLWLDFRRVSDKSVKKIQQRLDQIKDLQSKIFFLKRLLETYKYAVIGIIDDLKKQSEKLHYQYAVIERVPTESAHARARENSGLNEFVRRGEKFETHLAKKLKYLEGMLDIEQEERPANQPAQEIEEDEPDGPGWNAPEIGLALYALLRFAGLPKGFNQTKVSAFVSLLTKGRSRRKMENAIRNADGASCGPEVFEAVAAQFDNIGLSNVAAEVRRKFYKIGTGYRTRTKS